MDWLTWELAFTVAGTIIGTGATFAFGYFTFLYKLKSDKKIENEASEIKYNSIKESVEKIQTKMVEIEEQLNTHKDGHTETEYDVKSIRKEIETIKRDLNKLDRESKENLNAKIKEVDKKLDKFSDLLLKFLSSKTSDSD